MVMGLGEQQNAAGKATFSEDVLKLEVSGPNQEHFSVVNVPGIFRKQQKESLPKQICRWSRPWCEATWRIPNP